MCLFSSNWSSISSRTFERPLDLVGTTKNSALERRAKYGTHTSRWVTRSPQQQTHVNIAQTHPMANKFRKKPFLLYDTIAYLVDDTQETGKSALRAGQKSAFKDERSLSWFVLQVQSQRGRLSHRQLYHLTQRLIQDDELATPSPRRTTASAHKAQVLLRTDARRCAAYPLIRGCPK